MGYKITTFTNPRQVVLITCRHAGKDNVFAVDWHTPLSFQPKMYAISVGKTRFSYELIRGSGCFVANFVPARLEKEIYFCGSHSGRDVDKFKATGLQKEEAEKINCPRLKEALAWFECKVVREVEVGDHVLFIAEVVNESSEVKREKRLFHLWRNNFTTTQFP